MGGRVPNSALVLTQVMPSEPEMVVLSVEDMIADRMGQYASGTAREMLGQARALYALPISFDRDYLTVVSGRKVAAIMASKTLKPDVEQ